MAKHSIKVVVTSCLGGSQGDMGVVRTLGRAGVPVILLSEYDTTPAQYSRYVDKLHVEPGFTQNKDKLLKVLLDIAEAEGEKLIVFPTADPDLVALSEIREQLQEHYALFLSSRELIETCLNKGRFFTFANDLGFPIPQTYCPTGLEEVERYAQVLDYPMILKPLVPQTWGRAEIQKIVDEKKALVIHDQAELVDYYCRIAQYNTEMAMQEYVPGRDDRLFSLHIYMNKAGEPLAYFTGQKIRTYPTYAGIGCFVRSVYVQDIVDIGVDILRKSQYTGLALLQFKQDPRDGQYKLLEINPRASSWNLLAYECGINLPYIAYLDTLGLPVPEVKRQKEGVQYVYFGHDLRAFLDYRKHGDWSTWSWLKSLIGHNVYQCFALDDLRPFTYTLGRSCKKLMGKLARRPRVALGGRRPRQNL